MTSGPIPTLLNWCSGLPNIQRLTTRFYEKVSHDPVLAPVFAGMDPHHADHVAAFVAESLRKRKPYTKSGGSHAGMIGRHLGRHLTDVRRKRWISVMLDTVNEIGPPNDPEFRAAFVGYLEWGTRLAVLNSRDSPSPTEGLPMPVWRWGPPGGPSCRSP
jgi:hemoglobin